MPQHLSGNKEGCTHELCHAQAHIEVSRGFSHSFPFSEVTTKLIGLRRKYSNSGPATFSVFPCSAPGYRFSLLPPTAVGASRNLIASCSTKAVIRGANTSLDAAFHISGFMGNTRVVPHRKKKRSRTKNSALVPRRFAGPPSDFFGKPTFDRVL